MFCENCGCSLEPNAKYCADCGASTIGGLDTSVEKTNGTMEEWTCETHWTHFWSCFVKGLIGFGIGAVFAIVTGTPSGILYLGLAFAGVPYGWNLITRITGSWMPCGIVGMCIFCIIKLFLSLSIGITLYPPLLFYHLVLSQKPKTTAQTICAIIFVLSIIASFLVVFGLLAP